MKDKEDVKWGDRVRYLNNDYESEGEPSRYMAGGVVEGCPTGEFQGIYIKFDSDGKVLYAKKDEWEYYDESSPASGGKTLSTLVAQMTPENSHADAFAEAPDTDGWIKWEGGDCPVQLGTQVDVRHSDGNEYFDVSAGEGFAETWQHRGSIADIIAYRVVSDWQQIKLEGSTTPTSCPNHYMLFPEQGIQVKDVNKAWMDKLQDYNKFGVTFHEAGWLVKTAEYVIRSPFKEDFEDDLTKAIHCLQIVLDSYKARTSNN